MVRRFGLNKKRKQVRLELTMLNDETDVDYCDTSYAGGSGCTNKGPVRADGLPHCDACWTEICWEDYIARDEPLPNGVPEPSVEWLIAHIRKDLRIILHKTESYAASIERKLVIMLEMKGINNDNHS
jgi:hypothetical protein